MLGRIIEASAMQAMSAARGFWPVFSKNYSN
jgi:hypothetical protein